MEKLNLGCGTSRISGAVNVDCNPDVKPDIVCNFIKEELPFPDGMFDEVYLFHTIEHIEKRSHQSILEKINRVMKEDGRLIISYPEFSKIVQNWLTNFQGKRQFWEATIYGRQLYPSDYHVCAMDSDEFKLSLEICGFYDVECRPEPIESYNTVVKCFRTSAQKTYEQLVYEEVFECKQQE